MSWSFVLSVATMFAVPLAAGVTTAHAAPASSVLDPVTHENLSVYFVRGHTATGPVPLTLQEAILKGSVNVHETGQVNELIIENTGTDDVFVQAGDIVKGGKQDRVLTVSLLIPSGAGKIPIGAYCVEQGRWSPRGVEDAKRFSSSEKSVPSREAKLAMLAPAKPARPRTDEHLNQICRSRGSPIALLVEASIADRLLPRPVSRRYGRKLPRSRIHFRPV